MASGHATPKEDYVSSDEISTDTDFSENSTETDSENEEYVPELKEHENFIDQMSLFFLKQLGKAIFASLLNDYVESEFFLIDGDSLLIACSTDETLKTGQDLHFIFLVERFLLNLTNKGARYGVVFFQDMDHLYMEQSNLICLRTQLKLHLENNTDTAVHIFSSILSPEWKQFLLDEGPYFMMISDEGWNLCQTQFLNLMILHTLGNKTDVVLMAGQQNDHLRVYGYHINSKLYHQQYKYKNNIKMTSVLCKLLEYCQMKKRSTFKTLIRHLQANFLEKQVLETISHLSQRQTEGKGQDIRIIITTVSCALILKLFAKVNESNSLQDDKCCLTMDEVADLCKMYCLTVAILMSVPLSQRAKFRSTKADWNSHALLFVEMLSSCENTVLQLVKSVSHSATGKIDWRHVCDINDELLFKNIVYYYEKEASTDLKLYIGGNIGETYAFLWETTLLLFPQEKGKDAQCFDIRTSSKAFLSDDSFLIEKWKKIPTIGLMPMQSPLIEEYAGDIMKDLPFLSSDNSEVSQRNQRRSYDELLHWHSGRPLSDDYDRTRHEHNEQLKDKKELRKYQKLQTFQRFYGESLGFTMAKKIAVQEDAPETTTEVHKSYGKKKGQQVKKKDKIIQENQKKSKAREEEKEVEQWKTMAITLEKEILSDIVSGIQKQEHFVRSIASPSVKCCADLAALKTCVEVWHEHCKLKFREKDINIAVEIMKKIQTIMKNYDELLKPKDRQRIAKYLADLGFVNLAHSIHPFEATGQKNEVESSIQVEKKTTYTVGVHSVRFQMQFMGPHLFRDERTDPDPRVQHFIPDNWQRELLDVVDNNDSAVIVAPTSSGKTYASYYCMEKVLRRSDESVVVYVAPTKALVNQVVATVSNQFMKNLPKGTALCGVFTRDYRTDALNCQVLVTVPQCLEILLLSPHRQDWVKRIEYVIFDEVHCLGGEIGAEVWEHILVMMRCPFLALSATISNPEHLKEWLQSVKQYWQQRDKLISSNDFPRSSKRGGKNKILKKMNSYKVRLVLYERRYNDLEKYMCLFQDSIMTFKHYHPCAALTVDHIKQYGIPKDLSFSPRESLILYDAMMTVWPEWPTAKELDPEENIHLKDKIVITKNDASKYEADLKRELINWTENGHKEKARAALKLLQVEHSAFQRNSKIYFPLLVEKMKDENKLPALFFAFDIKLVECFAKELGEALSTKKEMKCIVRDKEIQKTKSKMKRLEKAIEKRVTEDTRKRDPENTRKRVTEDTRLPSNNKALIDIANYDALTNKYLSLTKTPPGYTYADNTAISEEFLEEIISTIKFVRNGKKLESLARQGIGYHHGSMYVKERRLVEMLFRAGFIKVVTATGTLALGINMPCKSVVFLQDSVYLDALNYRQMSGRAGRRGQDLLGDVIFFDIPMPKVKKLLKSNVPQLKGQFPLNISLILRLMLLSARADDKEDAKAKALSIFMHSLVTFKQATETRTLKLYCLFSLHYLIHEGYLDEKCNPLDFAGLITHLHYHEPSNFIFVIFLEEGLFRKLCQPSVKNRNTFPDSVMESLVLVLAHLFGRLYFLEHHKRSEVTYHQSKVFLDELPRDFASAVRKHNKKVASIFGHCLLTAAKLADMEKEYMLPLSKFNFSGKECTGSPLLNHLMDFTIERNGISPFACLSGNTDHDLFAMENVASLMLQTAQIPSNRIPILYQKKKDLSGRKKHLNSYALDFFKHGSLTAIEKENALHHGNAYAKLKDFSLSISAISISLKEMCDDEYDPVVLAFAQLAKKYKEKVDKV